MNIQSEIDFFSDLALIDKARFVTRLMIEVAEEARVGAGDGQDLSRLKFAMEINQRLARFSFQLLSEDVARPADDVMIRMLLGARADQNAERIMQNAYRRVLTGFETFDTTVLLPGASR
jgi:folate-dependent tRNA-U54 methylase TrmFO/GidA